MGKIVMNQAPRIDITQQSLHETWVILVEILKMVPWIKGHPSEVSLHVPDSESSWLISNRISRQWWFFVIVEYDWVDIQPTVL